MSPAVAEESPFPPRQCALDTPLALHMRRAPAAPLAHTTTVECTSSCSAPSKRPSCFRNTRSAVWRETSSSSTITCTSALLNLMLALAAPPLPPPADAKASIACDQLRSAPDPRPLPATHLRHLACIHLLLLYVVRHRVQLLVLLLCLGHGSLLMRECVVPMSCCRRSSGFVPDIRERIRACLSALIDCYDGTEAIIVVSYAGGVVCVAMPPLCRLPTSPALSRAKFPDTTEATVSEDVRDSILALKRSAVQFGEPQSSRPGSVAAALTSHAAVQRAHWAETKPPACACSASAVS